MDKSNAPFRELLDNFNTYPTLYLFKFIVTKNKLDDVKQLFPNHEIIEKPSKGEKYISTTIKVMVKSTDEIINLYQQASKIEGIIPL